MELIGIIESHPLHSILAGLVTSGLGYILVISFGQRKSIKAARENIISALQPELDKLIQSNDDCRLVLDSNAFQKHEAAIRNNIHKLSFIQRSRLRRSWERFAYHKENKRIPFYEMYSDCGALDKRTKMKPLAISRIRQIRSIVR